MPISNRGKYSLIALVLLTSMFLLSGLAPAQNNEENAEVSRLLSDAREKAAVLSPDADEMEALTRSEVSWQSHAAMLDTMKEDVNELAKSVEKLNGARESASSWQRPVRISICNAGRPAPGSGGPRVTQIQAKSFVVAPSDCPG